MEFSTGFVWLVVGVVLLGFEATGAPGIGFLFAGFGALCVGIALQLGLITQTDFLLQGVVFALSTAASAVILWKPMQRFHIRMKNKPSFDNLIGATATVLDHPLVKGRDGKVMWSGTRMTAELAETSPINEIPVGERVTILEAKGSLLVVAPILRHTENSNPLPLDDQPRALDNKEGN